MKSNAKTVAEYLKQLPPEKQAELKRVRAVIRKNLDSGFVEAISWGTISYEVPLARFPHTYNGHPLTYVALAAQKNHLSLYLMPAYADSGKHRWLAQEFKNAGKKLDMGKSCIRFQRAADLPLDAIGQLVASTSAEQWVTLYAAASSKRR
jgi:uncharacterized protein YdhG (YjbR/CyaY superfamily)